jgi:hypothetical protein
VIGTYDSALSKGLPLPGYTYKLLQKRLNTAWATVLNREETPERPTAKP